MKRASNPLSDLKHSWRNNWCSTTGTNKIALILFVTLFFFGPLHYLRLCKSAKLMYRGAEIRVDHSLKLEEIRETSSSVSIINKNNVIPAQSSYFKLYSPRRIKAVGCSLSFPPTLQKEAGLFLFISIVSGRFVSVWLYLKMLYLD